MYIADLHIHSRFSRATSKEGDPEHLRLWAQRKGIRVVGTGDFTHPDWRRELEEKLEEAGDGLYRLKKEYRLEDWQACGGEEPLFVVSGEISSIYKKNGKVRKVHNVILLPGLEEADRLAARLEAIGNIHSDGRPILGLDCRDLLEILLDTCPEGMLIPAHIWTPHFSLLGAFSGFDTVEECFGDLTLYVHAVETGLSSDPPMNWRLSMLDDFQLVSSSDAHSPAKLGREATLFEGELSWQGLKKGIETGDGLGGTIEFYPEEGKYHMDGHRKCHLCLTPAQTKQFGGRCPVCGKKITIGVYHRAEELADRPEGYVKPRAKSYESLVPLPEVIASAMGFSASSVKTAKLYREMLTELGPEFEILRRVPEEAVCRVAGLRVAEGIRRLRSGQVEKIPGYDGEYGIIRVFAPEEARETEGQMDLFSGFGIQNPEETLSEEERLRRQILEARKELAAEREIEEAGQEAAAPGQGIAEWEAAAARQGTAEREVAAARQEAEAVGWDAEITTSEDGAAGWEMEASGKEAGAAAGKSDVAGRRMESDGEVSAAYGKRSKEWQKTGQEAGEQVHPALRELNPAQRRAAEATAAVTAVIAGPGTGKTKTLISRILWMLQGRKIPAGQITAVTFTKKAAAEMEERLSRARDGGGQAGTHERDCGRGAGSKAGTEDEKVQIGTFHSICYGLLRDLGREFSLTDDSRLQALAEEARKAFRLEISVSGFLREVSLWKAGHDKEQEETVRKALDYYEQRMKEEGLVDFDDLLLEVLRFLEQGGRLPGSERFQYLLVDEFQDISPVQYRLIQAWGALGKEVFVIGDPDQSIYGFRGSDARCFDVLQKDFPEMETIRLEENYRSTRQILSSAQQVISHNPGAPRRLHAARGEGCPVRLVRAGSEMAEAIFVAREINRLIGGIDMVDVQEGKRNREDENIRSFSDIAVLYRTHRQAELLETCLKKEGIPFQVAGREDYLRDPLVRGTLQFFESLRNPAHLAARTEAIRLLWGTELEDLGEQIYGKQAEKYRPQINRERPVKLLGAWMEELDQGSLKAMEKLVDLARCYSSMEELLDTVVFGEEGDVRRMGEQARVAGCVTLMTLHGSKGLEFPVVILYGVKKGMLPLEGGGRAADPEEERRLFFVGMTRAREELVITTSEEDSPFLAELPGELVKEERTGKKKEPEMKQMSLFNFI